jgi:hypothetical protein
VVNAAGLNNLIDQATALTGLIQNQTVLEPAAIDPANDRVMIYDASAAGLRRALVSALQGTGTVTSVSMTVAPTTIFSVAIANPTSAPAIAFTTKPQLANAVLAGPVTGSGIPTFRALVPTDIPTATVTIAASLIDWNLGGTFFKDLGLVGGPVVFTFSNPNEGQTIRVGVLQGSPVRTVAWPGAVRWPGGTVPVMTATSGRTDIYTFHKIGGVLYGTFNQNFL